MAFNFGGAAGSTAASEWVFKYVWEYFNEAGDMLRFDREGGVALVCLH